jgi:hypothetical protein
MTNVADTGKIYIVLTRTQTWVARAIRMITGEPYSHVSLSFDGELNTLYSFARRQIRNPLNAGFIEEHLETGIFGLDSHVDCEIYCLHIPKEGYDRIRNLIEELLCNKEDYGYNFLGLFTAALNYPYSSPKKFFCSQFVAWALGVAGIELMPKTYALMRPENFRQCLDAYRIYEGHLGAYVQYRRLHTRLERRSVCSVEPLVQRQKGFKRNKSKERERRIFSQFQCLID